MIKTLIFLCAVLVFISTTAAEEPRVNLVNGERKLVLPENFRSYLEAKYSDYRLPKAADISYIWATGVGAGNAFPYVTWGDYDGNGLTDIAIFLIGKEKKNWEFAILLQTPTSYTFEFGTGSDVDKHQPQAVYLRTLKKGEPLKVDVWDFSTKKMNTYTHRFPNDAVLYSVDAEDPTQVYFWEKGELAYEEYGAD